MGLARRVRSTKGITNDGISFPGVPDPDNWSHLKADADGMIPRPELDTFNLAMVGDGMVSAASYPFGTSSGPEHLAVLCHSMTYSDIVDQNTHREPCRRVQPLLTKSANLAIQLGLAAPETKHDQRDPALSDVRSSCWGSDRHGPPQCGISR